MRKRLLNKKILMLATAFLILPRHTGMAAEFTEPPHLSVTKGNLKDSSIGGNVTQTFSETRHVAQETSNQGGAGGSSHVYLGSPAAEREKHPQDYFDEGKRYFHQVPPDFTNAATCFLRAAGAEEQHIKVESYLHYARCVFDTNPDSACTYYRNTLALEPRDEAYRGLMQLDYALSVDAEDDPEYLTEVLRNASENGSHIRRKTKEDRTLIKEITAKLTTLTLAQSTPVATSSPHPVVDQKPSAIDDISVLSSESTENSGKGKSVSQLLDDVLHKGNMDALAELTQIAETDNLEAMNALIQVYKTDDIVDADFEKVYQLALTAANKGDANAQFELAECYDFGRGVLADKKKAQRYYKFASNQGHAGATKRLNDLKTESETPQKEEQEKELNTQKLVGQTLSLTTPELQGVARPIAVPEFARGYESIYNRFINGKLIFDNGEGQRKDFSFSQFADTLTGEFDLRGLKYKYEGNMRDVNEYLRIKVGVRTTKENEEKTTIWFTPKFMVDRLTSHPWKGVNWSSDVGIFWSWGTYEIGDFAYLTTTSFDEISSQNLLKLSRSAHADGRRARERQLSPLFLTKFE